MRRPLALSLVVVLAVTTTAFGNTPFFADAPIRSVQFVDRNEGWAVGDDGVIWHTIDGGSNWERQSSGVNASLRGVHFLTPYTGWIVGRQETRSGSVGVVLFTTDGGLKWTQVGLNAMPGLNCVRFFDGQNGVVAGDGSDAFPTGVFSTSDGGQTWRPIAGPRCPSWLAADFTDAENGVLAGAWGRLAPVRNGLFGVAEVDSLAGRGIHALKVQGRRAVAVGQGGLILVSNNSAGVRWGFATPRLPREILGICDFHAVSIISDHIWVVGRPGTFVFHSPDFGRTWEMQSTQQSLPLHGVHFLNENDGWAVGELGVILSTRDGGKTWKTQREGGQRAAVLCVHGHGRSTPLDALAWLGTEEGYLTTALQVGSPDPASAASREAVTVERVRAATRRVGGASAETLWQFPIPHHLDGQTQAAILAHWNTLHNGNAAESMLRQLVLTIRLWQPEIVIGDAMPSTVGNDAIASLTHDVIKEAFKKASEPTAFPEQIEKLGLKPWAAKKLYSVQPNAFQTQVQMDIGAVQPRLADTLRNYVAEAFAWLDDRNELPRQRHFRLVAARLKNATDHQSLMDGVELAHGGTARRPLEMLPEAQAERATSIEKALNRWTQLETLARGVGQGDNPLATPDQVMAHLIPALKEMPADQGARAAFALAKSFADAGQWHMAREAFLFTAERYPSHPQAIEAYRWLIRYHSSSEARRRQELGHFLMTTDTTTRPFNLKTNGAQVRGGQELVQASNLASMINLDEARKWYQGSIEMEPKLQAFGPLFGRDPAIQLCLNASRRQLGDLDKVNKWYADYLRATAPAPTAPNLAPGDDPYRDCVMAEVWLRERNSPNSPKPLGACRRADQKPRLDGKLDDACWDGVRPLSLRDANGDSKAEYGTIVKWAYDRDFLYVGLICRHPQATPLKAVTKRNYDADLRGVDRVSIMLDLDRDYQTYFRFEVDALGRVADDCWGDKTWNPRWFVAVEDQNEGWTAEIAIPMRELTADNVSLGKVWACNVVRTVPGRGVQAWSTPADSEPRPEGMGLLQFMEDPKAKAPMTPMGEEPRKLPELP